MATFLKLLNQIERIVILTFFQQLVDNSTVSKSRKHAIILPVAKSCKDKTKISFYQPIVLISIFSKTFGRTLANRVVHFMITEQKLYYQHYGFVPFNDSRTVTYLIYKAITEAKLNKEYFVRISLDIKRAYAPA
ncbi:RNA-directed DNA polymerase from mobile element jockey [Trichonephila clavipes]|nr:RNA-directed DNA polymerase from mobile element jockey [Trichonephila clavipes]